MARTARRSAAKSAATPRRGSAARKRARSPARKAAAKKAPAKKALAKKPAAKKAAAKQAAPKRAARKNAARPPQRFTVSHARDAEFNHGLRSYAAYRDLGIAVATDGLVQAHVIRFKPPYRPEEASTPHYHDVDFQMVYVLKGWYRTAFEGEGEHTFEEGSCWIQPPGIKHAVLGYSDDCELLEIVLPAEFETVTVEKI